MCLPLRRPWPPLPGAAASPCPPPGAAKRGRVSPQLQRLTRAMETASDLMDMPSELLAGVLSKIAQPQTVVNLLQTCKAVHGACLALQAHQSARLDAPMVAQVVSISKELTEHERASDARPGLREAVAFNPRVVQLLSNSTELKEYEWAIDARPGLSMAVARGWVELLSLLCKHKNGWGDAQCERAAANRQLGVLEWVRGQDPPLPWGNTCGGAAGEGDLGVLQWARRQGAPWGGACAAAARGGHAGVLRWAREEGAPGGRPAPPRRVQDT